jgi:hypothetical protein
MTATQSPDASLMVGSLAESTQHVELQNVTTDARSRALRAPCWVIVLVVQLVAGGAGLELAGRLAQLLA